MSNADSSFPNAGHPDAGHLNGTIATLFARRSHSRLVDPGPSDDEIELLLSAAAAAPDHGEARPWRFVVFQGDDRLRFGDVLAASATHLAAERGETIDEERVTKEQRRFLRAPVVIAVLCRTQARRVIPAEQRDAVAAATQNLLIAATALGYGTIWRTGDAATSTVVRDALRLDPADAVVGFVYVGTVPADSPKPPRRLDATAWVERPPV